MASIRLIRYGFAALLVFALSLSVLGAKTSETLPTKYEPQTTTNSLTLKRESFQQEYQRVAQGVSEAQQKVQEGQAQMLRLEGAIRALQIVEDETSGTEKRN